MQELWYGWRRFPDKSKTVTEGTGEIDYINCKLRGVRAVYHGRLQTAIMETPEKLVGGMKIVLKLFDNAKGIFGVEDNKPDCIEKLKELTKDEPRMEVLALKTKYPQGRRASAISSMRQQAGQSTQQCFRQTQDAL